MRTLPALVAVALVLAGCSTSVPEKASPGLAPRGTTVTTAKPSRQDLTNKVSLTGKVAIDPVFGIVSPAAGQIRYLDVRAPDKTPTKPTKVATVGRAAIEVPAGATFSGRLVDDKSTVTAGEPVVSAKYVGYGIVADITGDQAYKLADSLSSVRAQIKSGPGPFACSVLGTIAALPAGTIPDPPADPNPQPQASSGPPTAVAPPSPDKKKEDPSQATGMRLVCTPPGDVKLINGAAATVEVVTDTAANALVLPVEAVAGAQGKGKVDVLSNGTRATKDVELGLTDGKFIQIKSGLTGDETVAVPGPNLPPGPDNNNGGGPGK